MRVTLTSERVIYANPDPLLVSRQAVFPGLSLLENGDILAIFSIGQAFDSADQKAYVSRSRDNGQYWSVPHMLNPDEGDVLESETFKPLALHDGTILATGYVFVRPDPLTPIVDPDTLALLPMRNKVSRSHDGGETWTVPENFTVADNALELSGPPVQLTNGRVLAVGAPFHLGSDNHAGYVIYSDDGGQTWAPLSTFYQSPRSTIAPWEARLAVLDEDSIAVLFWAYDAESGVNLNNHIVISHDNGATFGGAIDTGIAGQASNLIALSPDTILSIHCHRSDPVSLSVYTATLGDDTLHVQNTCTLFAATTDASDSRNIKAQFGSLRFGQPSLLRLNTHDVIAACWQVVDGQHVIKSYHLTLDPD